MLSIADVSVLVAYLVAVIGIGIWFARRRGGPNDYMAANRSLPGWAIGLSMFGSYVSSISFLANPGKAYAGNWNPFVFSITAPLAAAIAVRWFVPFYRRSGDISAYEHLERRFGSWARTYAVVCFLLYQMARTGTVIYLLAIAVAPLTGWRVETTILVAGILMTFYTIAGGIKAVVWTGVLQSAVLVAGTLICVAAILLQTPGGWDKIIETGTAENKFSLGKFALTWQSFSQSTFWVVLVYGLVINLGNFAIDQSYIQRYITARSDREAAASVWMTAWLYLPVAAIFFFIGTGLYVFYGAHPDLLDGLTTPDKIFPHFIARQLPLGMAGLVVAAIFAASMDSNLNSMATLTLCDLYQRYLRPQAGPRESMSVLYASTFAWGLSAMGIAFGMIRVGLALDAWWNLAGIFSGGILGLFLLGLVCRTADRWSGLLAVVAGSLVIAWMTLPQLVDVPPAWANPFHPYLTIVAGTLTIFLVGVLVTLIRGAFTPSKPPSERVS